LNTKIHVILKNHIEEDTNSDVQSSEWLYFLHFSDVLFQKTIPFHSESPKNDRNWLLPFAKRLIFATFVSDILVGSSPQTFLAVLLDMSANLLAD